MRRHHILLIGAIIYINRSWLHPAFLESLSLLLQPLSMLLVCLDQLNLLLGSLIVLLILLVL